jgi:hypothetical protein
MNQKFINYFFVELLSRLNRINCHNYNIISDAGIGDSIYAAIFCAENNVRSTLYTSNRNIEVCSIYFNRLEDIKNIKYNNKYTIYYSDRSNIKLINLIKIIINKSVFIKNSIFESFNLKNRLLNKLKINNERYYKNSNARKRFYSDLKIPIKNNKYISVYRSFDIVTGPKNYVVIHPFGFDDIRRLTKNQIKNIIKFYNGTTVYIVGSSKDQKYFDEYKIECNFYCFSKSTDLLTFMSGAKEIICVDSMISHLVTTLIPNPVKIYYGNTFASYYMPQKNSNIQIISNYQNCTPCNKISCKKINGFSCIQNIYL